MSTSPHHAAAVAGYEMARRLVKKAAKAATREAWSILTYPEPDMDGDFVRPDGGEWVRRPFVNWDHQIPIGTGRVVLKALTDNGKSHTLPVGRTLFAQTARQLDGIDRTRRDPVTNRVVGKWPIDECLAVAEDVWRLVDSGTAVGVSVEFLPVGKKGVGWWQLPTRSPINNRPSYHFDSWKGLGWAHAPEPVNRSAALLELDGEVPDSFRKAISLAETGRFPGGRQCTETVRKAFLPLLEVPRKTVARGGWDNQKHTPVTKAMDETAPPPDAAAPAGPQLPPTAEALMTVVQGIYDLCQQAEQLLAEKRLEHEKGKSVLQAAIDKLKADAGKLHDKTAAAFPDEGLGKPDDAAADTPAESESGDAPADDMAGDEIVDDDADEDADYPEMTEDGKVVTKAFKKGIPGIRRFKLSQLTDLPKHPPADELPDGVADALAKITAQLRTVSARQKKVASAVDALTS